MRNNQTTPARKEAIFALPWNRAHPEDRVARRRPAIHRRVRVSNRAHEWSFSVHGAMCARDQFNESFNFQQRWALIPDVAMATSARDPAALTTLALNLLDHYFRARSARVPDPRSLRFMGPFAAEMLAPLENCSWHLPLDSIHEWYLANRAGRERK